MFCWERIFKLLQIKISKFFEFLIHSESTTKNIRAIKNQLPTKPSTLKMVLGGRSFVIFTSVFSMLFIRVALFAVFLDASSYVNIKIPNSHDKKFTLYWYC